MILFISTDTSYFYTDCDSFQYIHFNTVNAQNTVHTFIEAHCVSNLEFWSWIWHIELHKLITKRTMKVQQTHCPETRMIKRKSKNLLSFWKFRISPLWEFCAQQPLSLGLSDEWGYAVHAMFHLHCREIIHGYQEWDHVIYYYSPRCRTVNELSGKR